MKNLKTVKPSVLQYMMGELERYIVIEHLDIPVWYTRTDMYLGNGEYEQGYDTQGTLSLGDTWEACYDCARRFNASVVIPPSLAGQKLYLQIDFGGEALVKVNGKITGAVSTGWVNRDQIFFDAPTAGEKFDIELEYAVDAGSFCDAAMDGEKSATYTLSTARLVAVDPVCEGYNFDVHIAWDALALIEDEYIKTRVYEALDESLHRVDFDFEDARVRASIKKAVDVLHDKLAKIKYIPQSEVIMTGHSHIDIAWLWRVQESERKTARTFSNNLALMDKYPEFIFAQSQAILYDRTKKLYPELYERIKEKVKNKQWDIVGNVWVEADTNVASGEALIRQLLYGREFFKKEFGVVSDTYWLPDCFGFSWALPQIIRRSGMKNFITTKLCSQDTNRFPHTIFRWKGNDGSEVLAYMQRTHYGGEYLPQDIVSAAEENDQKDVTDTVMGMFGYGDGGGGCTYAMMEHGKRLQNFPGLPASRIGHVSEFFDKSQQVWEDLPVFYDEMYYENHRGTYTTQAYIKKNNRKGEILLARAEMASIFAGAAAEHIYNKSAIEDAWKLLLKNQFHDILPGTSIREAHEDCRPDYERMTDLGEVVKTSALEAINAHITADGDGVVVWNLLSHMVSAQAEFELGNEENLAVYDAGKQLPGQYVQRDTGTVLRFVARDVPAMGYKVFELGPKSADLPSVCATKQGLENEYLKVELDENGLLTSVYDKQNDREVLCGKSNLLTVFQDKCVHEYAWNLELNYQKKYWELTAAQSIEVIESSELQGRIRIVRVFNKSTITQDIILGVGADRLDFDTSVEWFESNKLLKAAFEVDIHTAQATFETAHGAINRPNHWSNSFDLARFEQCAHKWADLSEGGYGVSLLNDCKYGYDIKDKTMRISLMRAPTCPDRTSDHGTSTFVYSLYPHKNGWQDGKTVQKAFELNVPLEAFALGSQDGSLPGEKSFLSVDSTNVIVDAIKTAQDGDGWILRLYEAEQRRGKVKVKYALPFERVTECNLMEENEEEIETADGEFSFTIKPFEVKTFRIR
ncbi:MAG TPA: glycoside hydrolase family 38 C-terminal domain-containing protein [Clostridia bacterium]|nr:glycoside hydrolase family 38 C-terminal domain-containing protein [Clostridia bacterium]